MSIGIEDFHIRKEPNLAVGYRLAVEKDNPTNF
jgi:hypothetical protein